MYIAEAYFKVLDEKGRVFLTENNFANAFVEECKKRKIKVKVYKNRNFYKYRK